MLGQQFLCRSFVYSLNILPLPMQAKILGYVNCFDLIKGLVDWKLCNSFGQSFRWLFGLFVLMIFWTVFVFMFFLSSFLISEYCALSWHSPRSLGGGTTKKLSVATMNSIIKLCPVIFWNFCRPNLQKLYSNT